jgi:hypothetical protein
METDTTCSNFGSAQVNESTVAKPEDAITLREMSSDSDASTDTKPGHAWREPSLSSAIYFAAIDGEDRPEELGLCRRPEEPGPPIGQKYVRPAGVIAG